MASGILGTVGFAGGAITGAAGGATSGFVSGVLQTGNFNDGLRGAGIGVISGGLLGGLSGGITAVKHGGNFWSGNGSTFDIISTGYQSNGEAVEYSNSSARSFQEKYFGKVNGLGELYADGTVPDGYTYDFQAGKMYNSKGVLVDGTTRYNSGGKFSNVYMGKTAFVSKEYLTITMGHELNHVSLFNNGYIFGDHEWANYRWTYEQARILNHPSANNWLLYSQGYMKHESQVKFLMPYVKKL